MAASFSTLPFNLVSATTPSFSSKQQLPQQLAAISSSLRSSASSTRLPIASAGLGFAFAFGSSSPSPVIRQKFLPANAASDETEAAVEILAEGEAEEDQPENVEAVEEPRPLRPPIVKLGDIMGILNKRAVDAAEEVRPVPDLRSGDIVQIKLEVPENKRRASIYKGIVISKQNAGIHTTIRIRRIIAGVGVEIVFPVYSPNIKEIKVVKHRKVRRARLYYLRDKLPRLSTFK